MLPLLIIASYIYIVYSNIVLPPFHTRMAQAQSQPPSPIQNPPQKKACRECSLCHQPQNKCDPTCKRCPVCGTIPSRPVIVHCDCNPKGHGRNRCIECLFGTFGHSTKETPAMPLRMKGKVVLVDNAPRVIIETQWNIFSCAPCGWQFNPNVVDPHQAITWPFEYHQLRGAHHWSNHGRGGNTFSCWSKGCSAKRIDYTALMQHLKLTATEQFCPLKEHSCPFCRGLVVGQAPSFGELMTVHVEGECAALLCIPPCKTRGTLAQVRACYASHDAPKRLIERLQSLQEKGIAMPSAMAESISDDIKKCEAAADGKPVASSRKRKRAVDEGPPPPPPPIPAGGLPQPPVAALRKFQPQPMAPMMQHMPLIPAQMAAVGGGPAVPILHQTPVLNFPKLMGPQSSFPFEGFTDSLGLDLGFMDLAVEPAAAAHSSASPGLRNPLLDGM